LLINPVTTKRERGEKWASRNGAAVKEFWKREKMSSWSANREKSDFVPGELRIRSYDLLRPFIMTGKRKKEPLKELAKEGGFSAARRRTRIPPQSREKREEGRTVCKAESLLR